jgi:hypothetical protein
MPRGFRASLPLNFRHYRDLSGAWAFDRSQIVTHTVAYLTGLEVLMSRLRIASIAALSLALLGHGPPGHAGVEDKDVAKMISLGGACVTASCRAAS